ncbi:MAG: hypothetical protein IH623_11525 [Verrucomicrobia bacterium]|nr:hypothetical protein [Verrucomicrobiota bacterium]
MKHHTLILLTPPTERNAKYADWCNARDRVIEAAKATTGSLQLGEHSWLIPRDGCLPVLGESIVACTRFGGQTRVWFLEGDELPVTDSAAPTKK